MQTREHNTETERRLCANCYKQLEPTQRYCPDCGQAARLHVPTLFEFVHEFASHYVALDRGVREWLVGEACTHG